MPSAGLRNCILLAVLFSALTAFGQFSNPVTTVPTFQQDGFGPGGDLLPYGGQEYCEPTSFAMQLSYLGINGFTQIAAADPTAAEELNLTRIMAGLMDTYTLEGTDDSAVPGAIATYLAAKGIGSSGYTFNIVYSPTVAQMATLNQPGTVVVLGGDYYTSAGDTNGGHCIALLNEGINSLGESSSNTIVVANPLPGALIPEADTNSDAIQYLNTVATTGTLTSDGSIELDPNQYTGFWGTTRFVITDAMGLTVNTSELAANNPAIATWTLSTTQSMDLNSGSLSVIAPVQGAGGFALSGDGLLDLQSTDRATGANTITDGTLRSDIASSTPFGSGAISIGFGTLALNPAAGSGVLTASIAGAPGNAITLSGAATLAISLNGNSALTLEIGGNTDGETPNIVRSGVGTLVIAPSGGISDLGANEKLLVNGSGSNLPAATNGILPVYIVSQNNDTNASADFLTYSQNGIIGATYVMASASGINSATNTTVYEANTNQTISPSATAAVYALKVDSGMSVSGDANTTLDIGDNTSGDQAGLLLNGGSVTAGTLNFGADEALIYSNLAGGTISSSIAGSGGITTFGPGTLTITAASTYTGPTAITAGIFQAANTSGAIGSGPITVYDNAILEATGTAAKVGGSGVITVNSDAELLLNGGQVGGSGGVRMESGSYLLGAGSIISSGTFQGSIGGNESEPSLPTYTGVEDISFTGKTDIFQSIIYSWKLDDLTDTSSDAGTDWSLLQFPNSASTVRLGTEADPINFTIDYGVGIPDPSSGNSFWDTDHQWLVATDPTGFTVVWWYTEFPTYSQGSFDLVEDNAGDNLYVDYTVAVPEPATPLLLINGLGFSAIRRKMRRFRRTH